MSRLIGYVANRADRMRDALYQERAVLNPKTAPPSASGWGIGFYHGDEVLHKKRPTRTAERVDWEHIAGNVHSDCAVLHLRQPTVGDFRAENAHPFRMRQWLFAHEGTIGRFDAIRASLSETIPDFIRRNIRGQTDSEYLFHTVLTFLHDAGQLDNPDVAEAQALAAIGTAVALVERLTAEVGATENSLSFILTNGRSMYALRYGAPMAYVERQGMHDPPDDYKPPPTGSTKLRYVMVVTDVEDAPVGYEIVPERSVAVINRGLDVTVHTL
ncbi:MAG: class II glutamine amidotransferase [Myxococcales bacterium]|nr:class II glutamine amidotransferase [Myxococcales bacterium]MDH3484166.1 class II glutamine amidotransferase [Myxococcales bacterium]